MLASARVGRRGVVQGVSFGLPGGALQGRLSMSVWVEVIRAGFDALGRITSVVGRVGGSSYL